MPWKGTYYGFFSASHNIGEGLSFVFVGSIVAASGAALGIVGIASYAAAGLQNVITGVLMDTGADAATHDFTYVCMFWLGAAVISFLLPILNWKRKKQTVA